MEALLAHLKLIFRYYSHLPIKELFDDFLHINIIVLVKVLTVRTLLKEKLVLPPHKIQLFLNTTKSLDFYKKKNAKGTYLYLSFTHSRRINLQKYKKLMQKMSEQVRENHNFIFLLSNGQLYDNIFTKEENNSNKVFINGIFLAVPMSSTLNEKYIQYHLSMFISACQLGHSHINLVFGLHFCQDIQQFNKLKKLSEQYFMQDDDELIIQANFCHIYQGLPLKISKEELIRFGTVEVFHWGHTLTISQGIDGIIFWQMENMIPILQSLPLGFMEREKQLLLTENSCGHAVFRRKKQLKLPIQDLKFTIIIFNLKPEFVKHKAQILENYLPQQLYSFKKQRKNIIYEIGFQQDIKHVERLSQLLDIDPYFLGKWLLLEDKSEKNSPIN